MLVIRLRRIGAKKSPYFRVVVTESSRARDGRAVEAIGHYDPRTNPETLQLNRARLDYWRKAGARASDTIRTLLARHPVSVDTAAAAVEPQP
jgi:small subunit ribosomal protein S16